MAFVPIDMPPGIVKQATEYSNKGRWTDGNLVRWVNGKMRPVGGWLKQADIPVTDPDTAPIRTLFSWVDLLNDRFTALGSNDRLFAYFGDHPGDTVIDITPSDLASVAVPGYGYGSGTYGTGHYGIRTPAPSQLRDIAIWSMDNYGEDLLAVHSADGRIFRWNRDTAPVVPAAPLVNAPTGCTAVIVADERHVVALGAGGDPRRIEWSDREDPEDWTPTATNQAGGWNLQTAGAIVGGMRVRGGILILTTTEAHLMRFIGGQLVYQIRRVGTNCGAFSATTMVGAYDLGFWMARDRFWYYDGAVKPLQCEVLEHVFNRINRDRPFAFSCGANTRFNEIWFHFPTDNDLNPTEYAAISFRDQWHWHIGKIDRSAWHDNLVYNRPIAVSPEGELFFHEFGWLDNADPRLDEIFAETSPIDIASGERTSRVRKLFQDAFDPGGAAFPFQIELKFRRGGDGPTRIAGPYTMDNNRGYTDVRGQGRQVQMRVINNQDDFWELGTVRLDITPGGRRGL